jgi:hypothetical protein
MSVNITITLPEAIIEKIDRERGDVNRSKFVLRLLERGYQKTRGETSKNEGGYKVIQSQNACPDLIVNECPLGCNNCAEIYINTQTGHHIICKCICGHSRKE